jgi:thymidylate synthase
MTAFDKQYQLAMKRIMSAEGIEEYSERTKHKTRAIPGLTIELEANTGFPVLTLRKIPIKLFIAEQVWFLTGSRRPEDFLTQFTKIWDDFSEIDGVVTAAYGYRWRHYFGRDQIKSLINLLTKEPSSRHAVVVTWDPATDGLNPNRKRKNVPCPYTFVVNIIGGALHMHNIVRSNDMILGFPHDVGGFAFLQHMLAQKLGVKVGKYTHSISNAHIYDIHYDAAKELAKRKHVHPNINLELPPNSFDRAMRGDKNLVLEIVEQLQTKYKPGEAISGLQIVL